MADRKIVTRFAPSPTGYLHIGGARTALFNWAFARQHGGTFVLRMEDTDQARSTAQSTRGIIEDLTWLGLSWDEGPDPAAADPYSTQIGAHGPYFQSQRLTIYRDYVDRLISAGRAYKCFKTPEELKAQRDAAVREKRPYKYDRTESVSLTPQQITQLENQGKPRVIRFRMPDADVTVNDLILGDVTVRSTELEDFVIMKSDGFPTFHLANVIDDALMQVTHVLRAQEHLMNTPKHVAIFDALGLPRPHYAHMPLIFNPDSTKMSKRDKAKAARAAAKDWLQKNNNDLDALATHAGAARDAVAQFIEKKSDDQETVASLAAALGVQLPEIDVHDFRASGYTPQVLLNYVALLGWSPGNDVERFDLDFLVKNFDLARIGKSNARFDRAKLLAFNAEALAKLPPDQFHQLLGEHDAAFCGSRFMQALGAPRFRLFADSYRERSRTLHEPFDNGRFFVQDADAVEYDPKAIEKVLLKSDGEGLAVLRDTQPLLTACGQWTVEGLEQLLKDYAQKSARDMGRVAQPLRVAVSGGTISPPIFDTLFILGKDQTLARIDRCLRQFAPQPQR